MYHVINEGSHSAETAYSFYVGLPMRNPLQEWINLSGVCRLTTGAVMRSALYQGWNVSLFVAISMKCNTPCEVYSTPYVGSALCAVSMWAAHCGVGGAVARFGLNIVDLWRWRFCVCVCVCVWEAGGGITTSAGT
jgi:hypothetical protein